MTKICFVTLPKKKKLLLLYGMWGGWVVSEGQRELLSLVFSVSVHQTLFQALLLSLPWQRKKSVQQLLNTLMK